MRDGYVKWRVKIGEQQLYKNKNVDEDYRNYHRPKKINRNQRNSAPEVSVVSDRQSNEYS